MRSTCARFEHFASHVLPKVRKMHHTPNRFYSTYSSLDERSRGYRLPKWICTIPSNTTRTMPTKHAAIFFPLPNRCFHLSRTKSYRKSQSCIEPHPCCHAITIEVQTSTRICVGANELRMIKSHQINQLLCRFPDRIRSPTKLTLSQLITKYTKSLFRHNWI